MRIKGILATFLSIAMVGQSVQAVPYGTSAMSPPFAVSIPSSLGYITDAYATHSASTPDMILIQNLHVNRSVQFAISKILKHLKTQGLMPDHIAVEGATGPIDIASMQHYPDPVIRKEAADYLVKQGEMPGAMHFAVTEGAGGLFGIETDEYYQANLEMFRRSYRGRTALRQELKKIEAVLPRLKRDPATHENALILEKDIVAVDELINNQTIPENLISNLKQVSQATEHLKLLLPEDSTANLIEPLSASVNFYALALLRDKELFKNTLSVRELGQQKTSIVVTGGFHTKGLTEECKQHGLSYVVITPRLRHHDKIDENLYIERLMGNHLTPDQVAQGLDWSLMEQLEAVYQTGSLFGSAVKAVTTSTRVKITTALLGAILLFSHGMQAQKKQLPPPPPLRTQQQWADFIHEQRPMTSSRELGLPLTFREAAGDHMPDNDAEMIVREATQSYDTALAVMDLDDAGKHQEAEDILIKLLTKSISAMDVRAYPSGDNHGAFMPHHRGASYLFNMTTADGSNLWPEWKFWTSNTGPSAWVAIAIVHHFEVTGEKNKTLMKELRSLGDAMLLLQDAKTQGGIRYGAHHTPDAPDYNQDFDRINSENEVSAHAALRKIAEATGDSKYTTAADNILHWLTQADIFNPETRQMQKGMMDPKTGLLFVDAVYQGGRWEIDPRHATDSGGTWTISSLTAKFIDEVWGKQASYRMWQSIRSNMGWTADYRRPGSGDEIAGVDFTNKDEGSRPILSRDALISPEWTGGAVRAVEHLHDYYENGAGKGQLTPEQINTLGKDVRSMRAWLETHPNNYAYGPGINTDRQGRTYWGWFSGHGTAMAAVYIRLNADPLSSGKNAIHISIPPVSQAPAAAITKPAPAAQPSAPTHPNVAPRHETPVDASQNLWEKGTPGQITDSHWESKVVWADFDPLLEVKKGEKYIITYTLTGSDVMAIQLIGQHESEAEEGDMQIVKHAGGKHSFEYTARSNKKVRRLAFQIGKNAWGRLGGSQDADMVIESVIPANGSSNTPQEKPAPVERKVAPAPPAHAAPTAQNIWDMGAPGEVTDAHWKSKVIWKDYDSPIELQKGQKLSIKYNLANANVMGIQLIGQNESEGERGDMQVVRDASGEKTITITVHSTKKVRRIAFQIGENAWGHLGGSQDAELTVEAITIVPVETGSLIEQGEQFLQAGLSNAITEIQALSYNSLKDQYEVRIHHPQKAAHLVNVNARLSMQDGKGQTDHPHANGKPVELPLHFETASGQDWMATYAEVPSEYQDLSRFSKFDLKVSGPKGTIISVQFLPYGYKPDSPRRIMENRIELNGGVQTIVIDTGYSEMSSQEYKMIFGRMIRVAVHSGKDQFYDKAVNDENVPIQVLGMRAYPVLDPHQQDNYVTPKASASSSSLLLFVKTLGSVAIAGALLLIGSSLLSQPAAAMSSNVLSQATLVVPPAATTGPLALLAELGLAAMVSLNVVYMVFKGVLALFNQYHGQQETLIMLRDRLSKVNLKIQTTSAYLFTIPMGYILDAIIRKRVDEKLATLRSQAAVAIAA